MTHMSTSDATGKRGFDLPGKTRSARARAKRIYDGLLALYPDARCELEYRNPAELLIATILSAQATDVSVNKATPALFTAYPTPGDYVAASPDAIEPYIKTIGLYRNKAKSIYAAMTTIVNDFNGEVPHTMDDLLTLRGVARKTANVVLGNAFGINVGVVVDTHVTRVATRFGLTDQTATDKIERDLMALFPRPTWTMLSHLLIFHGRRICKARGALCNQNDLCRHYCSNASAP
jgi:endonuclease-3